MYSFSGDLKSQPRNVLPPLTPAGLAKYSAILSASGNHEIIVSGNLPKGETTGNVTYWIVDGDTNAIVSQIILPDRSNQFNRVEMRLKVSRVSSVLRIGTFGPNGALEPVEFLTVRSDLDPSSSTGYTRQSA